MGRNLQRKDSSVQPRCMWGILDYLDYHHWHNVKKMDPHKKHHRGRHPRCWRNPKTLSIDHISDEVQELLDAHEADHFLDEQHTAKTSPSNKSSAKARIKGLIAKEMSKGENHKHWILGFPERSKLRRTHSLHHLEPSDHRLSGLHTGWTNPIIILRKNSDTSATRLQVPSVSKNSGELVASSNNQKQVDAKQFIRGVSLHQVKEYVDVLEIYKVDKNLFLRIMQDPDVGFSKNFPGQQTFNTKAKLTKSGSFPMADSSCVRYLRPSSLEHKQNEVWSLPKGEKLLSGGQVPKFDASKSQKDQSMPSLADDNSGSAMKQETSLSSQVSSQGLNNHWWNQLVVNHLKDIKQRIKHALKESKKKSNHTSMDALLQVPSGSTDGKEMSERLKTITMAQDGVDNSRSCDSTDVSDHNRSKGRLQRVRRTASLNESLDRYAQLFEYSFSKEAKLDHSKSLKMTSEEKISSKGRAPRFSRRISSMSDLESFCSLLNEVSRDAFGSDMPSRTVMDCNAIIDIDSHTEQKLVSIPVESLEMDKFEPLEAAVETEVHEVTLVDRNHEAIAKTVDLSEEKDEPAIGEICCSQEQEISFSMNPSREVAEPSSASVIEACFQDDITNPVELPISEGSGLNSRCLHIDEPDCFINSQNRSNTDSLPGFFSTVNHENVGCTNERVDDHFLHNNLDEMGDSDFNYVRDVLELSGLIGNEHLATWHSVDQPLNPSLFKELEAYLPHEFQCSEEENGSNCYHQLLFDLVNGALLEIYDKSYTYFPKAFSFSRRVCPMPKGHHVLEEVWSRVSWYLNSRPDLDQSLDDIVARDMAKGDGWMNLQLEAECVALDLEELIFDELLDEIICS